jgi:hypothetical protein
LTMSVHDDGYYRNTPCWQSFNYVLTWWWLLQKYAVLTIFWPGAYMMMVITEIRRVDNLLTMSVDDDGYYKNTPCWQSFDNERTWWWLLEKYGVLTIFDNERTWWWLL